MLGRIAKSVVTALVICAAPSLHAGPLMDAFKATVADQAVVTWDKEITEPGVLATPGYEGFDDIRITFPDGRVFHIDEMEVGLKGNMFDLTFTDVDLRPINTTLLLHADQIRFTGGPRQIQHIFEGKLFTSTCAMEGEARLEIADLGYINAAPQGSIEEDSKYRIMEVILEQRNSGSQAACKTEFDLDLKDVDFRPSGKGQLVSDETTLRISLPGSLASLAADRRQIATIDMTTQGTIRKIIGGASAWSVLDGAAGLQVEAISLVPALTYGLKNSGKSIDSIYLMELWNSLVGSRFSLAYDIQRASLRIANILDPQTVTGFEDAGLTTMLFNSTGTTTMIDGGISMDATLNVTGIADARLQGDFSIEQYPATAIALQGQKPSLANAMLPLKVNGFTYEHSDKGFNAAVQEIIGIQTTVRIGQLRDQYAENLTGKPAEYVRELATKAASFIARGIQSPPAVIDVKVNPQVNIREAMVIMKKAPEQITNILEFDVYSRSE